MINVQDIPAVRALLEQEQQAPAEPQPVPPAPQYARAPAGNGHEVALKHRSGQR